MTATATTARGLTATERDLAMVAFAGDFAAQMRANYGTVLHYLRIIDAAGWIELKATDDTVTVFLLDEPKLQLPRDLLSAPTTHRVKEPA